MTNTNLQSGLPAGRDEKIQATSPDSQPVCFTQPVSLINKERSHHEFGMSVLNYIAACPGFKGREGENEAARDGTRLHGIMEKVVRSIQGPGCLGAMDALRLIVETETVSEEEECYLEYCCRELDKWLTDEAEARLGQARIECRVYIRNPNGTDLNFGHYDYLLFESPERAILFDWKFGWIPVPEAASNWQGKGYVVGVFQEFPRLKEIGVVFVQPKLHRTTVSFTSRPAMFDLYQEVRGVIERAQAAQKQLSPGPYCDFCRHAATCTALLNEASRALAVYEGLPIPDGFAGLQISTPEDAARAMFVLDRLEVLLEHAKELKERAKEFARASNNMIGAPLPDGRMITVELKSKNAKRVANSPGLIAEALKEWLSPEQVLAACDPKITALEDIFAEAFVSRSKAEAQAITDRAEAQAAKLKDSGDLTGAAQVIKQAKAEAKQTRVSKKRAAELLNATLQAEGLLTRPDNRVEYLKVRIEKPIKQITEN